MIRMEGGSDELRKALLGANFTKYYVVDEAIPWIVGFFEKKGSGELNPFVFATLRKDQGTGQWKWEGVFPSDLDDFFSYAEEVELNDYFRKIISQYKHARSHDFGAPDLG